MTFSTDKKYWDEVIEYEDGIFNCIDYIGSVVFLSVWLKNDTIHNSTGPALVFNYGEDNLSERFFIDGNEVRSII